MPARDAQSTTDVLLIRPANFASNPETLASNRFQNASQQSADEIRRVALAEFDALANALRTAGVSVHVVDDTVDPIKPDAVFPNNWFSTHPDGTVVLYPMLAPNRRLERRLDVIETLHTHAGFHVRQTIDLSHREQEEKFLEGTGSLVLDRINRVAYACLSPRTDLDVLGEFAQRLDYDIVAFDAADKNGAPIYHTNVLMSVGTKFAAVCTSAIAADRRGAVVSVLEASGRTLIDLSFDQMHAFAGNMLEVRSARGGLFVAMSETAMSSLTDTQRAAIEESAALISVPIPTIEQLGGGSVRCMLAEIFLPRGQ